MITKLKYVGVSKQDLLDIYILFIRSVIEYCSVSFHSSLTQDQTNKLEKIQKTCLKVILGEDYEDYDSALKVCNLDAFVYIMLLFKPKSRPNKQTRKNPKDMSKSYIG